VDVQVLLLVLEQRLGRLRNEDLPAVSSGSDPSGTVDCEAGIAAAGGDCLTRVQSHPYLDSHVVRPLVSRKRELAIHCREEPVSGAGKRDEEGIALRVDLVSTVGIKSHPQQALVLVENVAVALAKLFDESRRPFDVREQEGDCAAGEVGHFGTSVTLPSLKVQPPGQRGRGSIISSVNEDEWRVEIDLDDEAHGFGLGERFRAHDLDDEARKRLGHRIVVTRNGPHVFLYAGDEAGANQAEMIARELVATDDLSADITVTRWHPLEEEWLDASIPLPRSEEEQQEELERREETERLEGTYDWLVKIDMPSRSEAEKLEELLQGEGLSVHRRWRYVTVDVATEEHANELAARLRDMAPAEAEISVDANPDDIPTPVFVLLESKL
jgi:hypothetical protein